MTEHAPARTVAADSSRTATPHGFRALMSAFPSGVVVVTALDADGVPRGMTCSSMCSVALDPPTLLVCLRTDSPTLAAVRDSGGFALGLLHEDARETALLFASGDPHRFNRVRWEQDAEAAGPHLPDAARATADCEVLDARPTGDHTVVIAGVRRIVGHGELPPLLYGLRAFHRWPGG
ncbi:flavin reductase family protein [Streptomyces sp. NPDC050388]|uniref:flavin reductase family protein n=1 Tax=Streptomyces sp. NPDC050388 TaxID=3155781 RepID=UPI00343C47F0